MMRLVQQWLALLIVFAGLSSIGAQAQINPAPRCDHQTATRAHPSTSTRSANSRRSLPSNCATARRPNFRSLTSATSMKRSKASSRSPPIQRSWRTPATLRGTWESYSWLLTGKDFESIHPSLQRQAVLNMAYGLYEVLPGRIYQVRGYDLANISFIKGDTGWIAFDP